MLGRTTSMAVMVDMRVRMRRQRNVDLESRSAGSDAWKFRRSGSTAWLGAGVALCPTLSGLQAPGHLGKLQTTHVGPIHLSTLRSSPSCPLLTLHQHSLHLHHPLHPKVRDASSKPHVFRVSAANSTAALGRIRTIGPTSCSPQGRHSLWPCVPSSRPSPRRNLLRCALLS